MFFGIQYTIHQSGFTESKVNRRDIADYIVLLHIQANVSSENIKK